MTKVRAPTSFEDAITRIAGRIGWAEMAGITGKAERTVRNWSDPETGAVPSIDEACRLDAAYLAAGGGDPPIGTVYAMRLKQAVRRAATTEELVAATGVAAVEGGQAIAALIAASQPDACEGTKAVALREVQEAVSALSAAARKVGGGQA
jgi:hypothetical protein